MITEKCLQNLNKIINIYNDGQHCEHPASIDPDILFKKFADIYIQVSTGYFNIHKFKYLLWNFDNLLPGVKDQFTGKLFDKLNNFGEHRTSQNRNVSCEKKTNEKPEPNPEINKSELPSALHVYEDDWFDKFLDCMVFWVNGIKN